MTTAHLFTRSTRFRLLLAAAAVFYGPASARSDDERDPSGDIEDYSLEDLLRNPVTSATGGVEVESDVVPANVTTISRDDIQAHGWQSVAEVLQHVAGLYVIDDQVLPAVAVRGISGGLRSGSRIVKVMINGTEVNFRPDQTAMLGREYLPILAVERIEIARGPLSALYGANAFLATVNVVTRTASQARSEIALSGERHQGDGNSGLGAGGSALFSGRVGPHALVLAARFDRLDRSGLVIRRTFASQAASDQEQVFDRPSDFDLSRPLSLFANATSQGRFGDFALQGGYQRMDAYGEFQPDSTLTHQSRHSLQNSWASLSHTKAWIPKLTSTVTVGASRGSPTSEESLVLGSNRNSMKRLGRSSHFDTIAQFGSNRGQTETLGAAVHGVNALERRPETTRGRRCRSGETDGCKPFGIVTRLASVGLAWPDALRAPRVRSGACRQSSVHSVISVLESQAQRGVTVMGVHKHQFSFHRGERTSWVTLW